VQCGGVIEVVDSKSMLMTGEKKVDCESDRWRHCGTRIPRTNAPNDRVVYETNDH
jgi:hypothetical protein